jgi:hypothetical protein
MDVEKAPGEYRLIALGDSFTEGVGTSYDMTWLKVVEARLATAMPDRTFVAYNAGVSGSDPWFAYMLLRESCSRIAPTWFSWPSPSPT